MRRSWTLVLVGLAACAHAYGEDVEVPSSLEPQELDAGIGQDGAAGPADARALDASRSGDADASVLDASDASSADANDGGEAGSAACGSGSTALGEYATWYGKVNVHRPSGGAWSVDSDCVSGANVNTVTYCQKFWPASTRQVQLPSVTQDSKPFTSGGGTAPSCGGLALHPGQAQFVCCD